MDIPISIEQKSLWIICAIKASRVLYVLSFNNIVHELDTGSYDL